MILYDLTISCVDGDTLFHVMSPNLELVRDFLKTHDHEGSSVGLRLTDIEQPDLVESTNRQLDDQDAYEYLQRAARATKET